VCQGEIVSSHGGCGHAWQVVNLGVGTESRDAFGEWEKEEDADR
jgi:hypothetical protein